MTFTRLTVDEKTGRTKEEALPDNYKHASEEEVARRKRMEAELRRRRPAPFGALNPNEQANHPQPSQGSRKKVVDQDEEEDANIRENPAGGKVQGTADAPPEDDAGKDSGTEPSDEGDGEQDTPDEKEE